MSKKVGIWIDHHKAVIVSVAVEDEETNVIYSDFEEHNNHANQADDIRLRVLTKHLNNYYGMVISHLLDAESVFLFGPGEAKGELVKWFAKEHSGKCTIKTEIADKMTNPQIVEKVKKHFLYHESEQDISN